MLNGGDKKLLGWINATMNHELDRIMLSHVYGIDRWIAQCGLYLLSLGASSHSDSWVPFFGCFLSD